MPDQRADIERLNRSIDMLSTGAEGIATVVTRSSDQLDRSIQALESWTAQATDAARGLAANAAALKERQESLRQDADARIGALESSLTAMRQAQAAFEERVEGTVEGFRSEGTEVLEASLRALAQRQAGFQQRMEEEDAAHRQGLHTELVRNRKHLDAHVDALGAELGARLDGVEEHLGAVSGVAVGSLSRKLTMVQAMLGGALVLGAANLALALFLLLG